MTEQEIKSMWGNEVLRIGKICGKYEKGGIESLTKEEIDELVRRKLIELPKPKFPDNLPDEFQGLDFEFVERLGIYVAKKRTLFDKTFNDSDKILKENNARMLYSNEFVGYLKYKKENDADLFNEITEVREPWRSEWIGARYEKRKEGMFDVYRGRNVKLENYLKENKTPGIDLNEWIENPNEQGLPREDISKGKLYSWPPSNGRVGGFIAGSDGVNFGGDGDPSCSYSSHGVRVVFEAGGKAR